MFILLYSYIYIHVTVLKYAHSMNKDPPDRRCTICVTLCNTLLCNPLRPRPPGQPCFEPGRPLPQHLTASPTTRTHRHPALTSRGIHHIECSPPLHLTSAPPLLHARYISCRTVHRLPSSYTTQTRPPHAADRAPSPWRAQVHTARTHEAHDPAPHLAPPRNRRGGL